MSVNLSHSILSFEAGDVIFKDGDMRRYLYIVQKGQIAIFKETKTGERISLGLIGSGEYLGETGLLDGKLAHATWAVALTDLELIAIPAELILEQIKSVPPWMISLTRGMAQKLRHMNDLVRRNRLNDQSLDTAILAVAEKSSKKALKQSE